MLRKGSHASQSGYPNGLAGENIPHVARIVALADVFDALTSVRPYKDAWSVEDAINHIRDQSGKHFDPELVDVFMTCIPEVLRISAKWADAEENVENPPG